MFLATYQFGLMCAFVAHSVSFLLTKDRVLKQFSLFFVTQFVSTQSFLILGSASLFLLQDERLVDFCFFGLFFDLVLVSFIALTLSAKQLCKQKIICLRIMQLANGMLFYVAIACAGGGFLWIVTQSSSNFRC